MNRYIIILMLLLASINSSYAADKKTSTDANLVGHVVCNGEHLPFVNISLKGTTIGTVSDGTGHYELVNLPVGQHIVLASAMGYKPKEETIVFKEGTTNEIKFELEEDVLGLNEVVITGDRNSQERTEAMVIVNTLTPKLFESTQSVSLSEGLNFCPGLRTENNCSNCGFTQVRMNGMEGPYSQILINSRPIFSGLAGVYGLELIPSNMIEKIEVVRGGGSALYGSNAIAGTINLLLKDPLSNVYELGLNSGVVGSGIDNAGSLAYDHSLNVNVSVVSDDKKTGLAVYGFNRNRDPFDANGDDYSEMTNIENTTLGARLFRRFGNRSKASLDFFNINEKRRGGNNFDAQPHEANIAEAVEHKITTGALSYEQFFREYDLFSAFASAQGVQRDSYYGANFSLKDYGYTEDLTYNAGVQYKALFNQSTVTGGIEYTHGALQDSKLGYPDLSTLSINDDGSLEAVHVPNTTVSDQTTATFGLFAQYDFKWDALKLSLGGRFDRYNIQNVVDNSSKKGNVFSPRVNVLYNLLPNLQARLSYSKGYRAPQIFDEDLHILTSAARKVVHVNDADLEAETSDSYMASLNYNTRFGTKTFSVLLEGFYTSLNNPFSNVPTEPDENGTVVYTRQNADGGALIKGINTELRFIPSANLMFSAGITIQESMFDNPQEEFDERSFLRTPNTYGFINADWDFFESWCLSASSNYTGEMLIPYYGPQIIDPQAREIGELRTSETFTVINAKLSYDLKTKGSAGIQFFGGVKNLFNSYQSDFDIGDQRDPGYIYGPGNPRIVYLGIKIGNKL